MIYVHREAVSTSERPVRQLGGDSTRCSTKRITLARSESRQAQDDHDSFPRTEHLVLRTKPLRDAQSIQYRARRALFSRPRWRRGGPWNSRQADSVMGKAMTSGPRAALRSKSRKLAANPHSGMATPSQPGCRYHAGSPWIRRRLMHHVGQSCSVRRTLRLTWWASDTWNATCDVSRATWGKVERHATYCGPAASRRTR